MWLRFKNWRAGKRFTALDAAAFAERLKTDGKPILIDVRTRPEYNSRKIRGAQNIDVNQPPAQFCQKLNYLDRGKPIFLYCAAGSRSARAAHRLLDMGFTQVFHLKGGLRNWEGPTW